MTFNRTLKQSAILLACLIFTACGGGSTSVPQGVKPGEKLISRDCRNAAAMPGFDIFLLVGQSNMTGYGLHPVAGFDSSSDRVKQWSRANQIIPAVYALEHADYGRNLGYVGLGLSFGKVYAAGRPVNRTVLLVPAAFGGTGFSDGSWIPGAALYEDAMNRLNAALNQNSTGNCLGGILWHQGEGDTGSSMTAAEYQLHLEGMIAAMRVQVIQGRGIDAPFILGGFSPDWDPTFAERRIAFENVINTVPTRVQYTYAVNTAGLRSNISQGLLRAGIHFDAASQRELGTRYYDAIDLAVNNSAAR